MYYVYLLEDPEKELLVGLTRDLKRSLEDRDQEGTPSSTKRSPYKLLYYETFSLENSAKTREKELKRYWESIPRTNYGKSKSRLTRHN